MIAENGIDNCQSAACAEDDHEHDKVIDDDAVCVGFARLAIVLFAATLAVDMAHHFRSDRAALSIEILSKGVYYTGSLLRYNFNQKTHSGY